MTVWRGASPGATNTRAGGAEDNVFHLRVMAKRFNDKGDSMESQVFSATTYSLRTQDLIPPDDADDDDTVDAWAEYCSEARHVDRQHVLGCVLSSLGTDDSPLYALIDSALKDPHEPGRARESLTTLAQIGQAILHRVASSVDDQVNLRLATGGRAA